ncbi:hypothetical protein VNI00_010612 [Paramarasmius palmivorus]|uniref:Terpenoid synthase n=1 Tax=Paramarasmius palmivorus TaxID=297713 RepID=A0AAW0CGT8_9AGAR
MLYSFSNVDTSRCSAFFSTFPVKDCWDTIDSTIEVSLHDVIDQCTQSGTRERKRALYRHSNPAGNLFGLCLALCKAERVGIVAKLIEFLCIIDDVLEDLPHDEAVIEHNILCETLRQGTPSDRFTENTRPGWLAFLCGVKEEMLLLDPFRSPSLLRTFEESLSSRDSSAIEFDTIEEYIPYRLVNFDFEFVSQLLLWAMAIDLTPEDLDSDILPTYKYSIGVVVGLVNDYFSWNMEKVQLEEGDRVRNAVAVLLKQYAITERQAQARVKKIIIGEEAKALSFLDGKGSALSKGMRSYLEQLQMFAGGYSYWCATCPRYSRPQAGLDDSDSDQTEGSDE